MNDAEKSLMAKAFEANVHAIGSAFMVNDPKTYVTYPSILDDCARQLTLGIKVYILGKDSKTLDFEFPDGAWQTWKANNAPGWFKRRFPIKMKKVSWDSRLFFPDYEIPVGIGKHVTLHMNGPISWEAGDEPVNRAPAASQMFVPRPDEHEIYGMLSRLRRMDPNLVGDYTSMGAELVEAMGHIPEDYGLILERR